MNLFDEIQKIHEARAAECSGVRGGRFGGGGSRSLTTTVAAPFGSLDRLLRPRHTQADTAVLCVVPRVFDTNSQSILPGIRALVQD